MSPETAASGDSRPRILFTTRYGGGRLLSRVTAVLKRWRRHASTPEDERAVTWTELERARRLRNDDVDFAWLWLFNSKCFSITFPNLHGSTSHARRASAGLGLVQGLDSGGKLSESVTESTKQFRCPTSRISCNKLGQGILLLYTLNNTVHYLYDCF